MPLSSRNHVIWLYTPTCSGESSRFQAVCDQLHAAQIQYIQHHSIDSLESSGYLLLLIEEPVTSDTLKEEIILVLEQGCRVIVIYLGEGCIPFFRTWELLSLGVEDVIPFKKSTELGEILRAKLTRWVYISNIMEQICPRNGLIGTSKVWKKTLREVIEVACFSSVPVLILGESGTGKELISRLIHKLDKRPDKEELVLLDCTTIVPELSGSEFFGHEKGAFTNAIANRDGAFALANRGTLFLDEIGELPLRLQAELLRVIQEGIYKRIGSNIWKETTFRLVSATNRNLFSDVQNGKFRQDLYYRIQTCVISLPSLSERKSDIPQLAYHFLKQEMKTDTPPCFSPEMLSYLMGRNYPGNVRELKQLICRIAYRHCSDAPITLGDLPFSERDGQLYREHDWQENGFRNAISQAIANGVGLKDIKRIAGDVAMHLAIEKAEGNLQDAARSLGVSDRLIQGYWATLK